MTDDILQELEESARLGAEATRGPWLLGEDECNPELITYPQTPNEPYHYIADAWRTEDAAYIVYHSPDRIARWREAFARQAEELLDLRMFADSLVESDRFEELFPAVHRSVCDLRARQQKGDVSDEA